MKKVTRFEGRLYFKTTSSLDEEVIILRPLSKYEAAKRWAGETLANIDHVDVVFVIKGNQIICLATNDSPYDGTLWGRAICRHGRNGDKFDVNIGKAIAYCRAMGDSIPNFVLYEDTDGEED